MSTRVHMAVHKTGYYRLQQLELNEVAENLGAEDILDVISNFIADVDPTLQVSCRYSNRKWRILKWLKTKSVF